MSSDPNTATLVQVDALVGKGALADAADLLEAAIAGSDAKPMYWLQLAGLRRAHGQLRRALAAVHAALAIEPFNFMALVMRAGLLERLDQTAAGSAWEEALAQRPPGELPQALARAVEAGERALGVWQADRAARLEAAWTASSGSTSGDAMWRINRFRDNVLRKTRTYHSEPTHFHFPGLVEREFHPREEFPWLAELEASSATIRTEMEAALASERVELKPYIQYEQHEALAQWQPLNRNPDWSAMHLLKQGQAVTSNTAHCPTTMELLSRLPQPSVPGASPNAMFSLLAPQTQIPPHVGIDNSRLVCHLALTIPEGCWFRVGAETRYWEEGKAFVFDDTIEHAAANPTDRLRVVLIFDVWHPGLTPVERDAVAAIIAADGSAAHS